MLEFVRLVAELDARSFVFENVKGLTLGDQARTLDELIEAFAQAGYVVRRPWRVLDAAHYGAPQRRERLILFGAKRGTRGAEYPPPIFRVAGAGKDRGCGPFAGPTVAEALDDLPDAERFAALLDGDSVTAKFGKPSDYAAELRCLTNDAWHLGRPRRWDPTTMTSSARTGHTAISRRRFAATEGGAVEPISRFFKLPADGVSNTLRAGTDGARGAFTSPRPIHHRLPRCVTVREMARLHGFPDWFRFNVTKWHGARQIGNAVPPPLARAVAASVVAALGAKPSRPVEPIDLGDPALLRFDVTSAAAHFGVERPNS